MTVPRRDNHGGGQMAPIITSNAIITCIHCGQVVLVPTQAQVVVQGGAVLCEPDLVGSPIVGCAQPPTPTTKPCTTVISTLPGSSDPQVTVGGRPVYLATLSGITDGVPPGTIIVASPGQTVVV
jgi:hypothetical protein